MRETVCTVCKAATGEGETPHPSFMGLLGKILGLFGSGGRTIDELAARLGVDASTLHAVPIEYRAFTIPKRRGGSRSISAPAPELKRIQRLILRRLLGRLKAHECALGFERGLSFVDHARLHADSPVLVRIDIKDFFPSIKAKRVSRYFHAIGWGRDAVAILVRLCCKDGTLPQGAPTSPRLANLVNLEMDHRLAGAAKHFNAVYSRYADDIVFSFADDQPERLRQLINLVHFVLDDIGYRVNRRKGPRVLRRHQRQVVTGLVVNDGPPRLSRTTRRRLRAIEHRTRLGAAAKRPTLDPSQLAGWHALINMIEKAP